MRWPGHSEQFVEPQPQIHSVVAGRHPLQFGRHRVWGEFRTCSRTLARNPFGSFL